MSIAATLTTEGTRPLCIAIVGGGIGGILLAIGLQKHAHIDYHLYEAAPSFGEVGLGVAIGPNAQYALELIDPRARAVLNKLASTNMWESHMLDFVTYKCVSIEFLAPFRVVEILGSISHVYKGQYS